MDQYWNDEVWRGLVASAPDALIMIKGDGTIVFANTQTEKLFGYTSEELMGQKIELLLPERYRAKHVGQRDRYFSNPHVRPMGAGMDLYALRKNGTEVPVEISLSPLTTKDGLLVTGAIRDITDRKRFEADLKSAREIADKARDAADAARDAADTANRTKSEFLANMSHEIRTPLAGILGYSEMIALYCHSDEERRGYLDRIRRCSDSLTELINDILDLSKVEAGALRMESVPVPLTSDLESILSLMETRAAEKGIKLEAILERPLPGRITSDPTRLRQVLLNIIGNAIKFTEAGGVTLRVKYLPPDANGKRLLAFSVTDSGCGLSPEEQGRLFQPFVQADSSTTRKYGGTGLGLALSRRLARALGGDLVLAQSSPGKGSTFVLTIDPGQTDSASQVAPSQSDAAEPPSPSTLKSVRVLLAEDNPDNEEMVTRFLSHHGARVDVARNGADAVEKASAGTYDIVLMDIQMPVLDGYAATRKLREKGVRVPIIALTAHAMIEEREKCVAAGCDDFLTKPLDISRLIQTVARHTVSRPKR